MHTHRSLFVLALSLMLGPSGICLAEDAPESQPPTAEQNLAAFDQVWETVRDTHWDPTLGGLDWDACREQFRPTLDEAQDLGLVRRRIGDLLLELNQSHFGLIPASFYDEQDSAADRQPWVGIEFRWIDDSPIVTRVAENSPASAAGVRPGSLIREIDDSPVAEIIDLSDATDLPENVRDQVVFEKLKKSLQGTRGETVKLKLELPDGESIAYSLVPVAPPGEPTRFGNLPEMIVEVETRVLEDGIAYARFNWFLDPPRVLETVGQLIEQHRDAPGLIIDLRGNPGGIGAMAMGVASWVAAEPQGSLGQLITRDTQLKFTYFKRQRGYTGPVAILVDERSMSTSEILAGGLQTAGRSRIVGRQSPGAALPSSVEILPNGDRFLHAFANFTRVGGEPLEGVGVIPDIPVALDREKLAAGIDQDIEAARQWIERQSVQLAP